MNSVQKSDRPPGAFPAEASGVDISVWDVHEGDRILRDEQLVTVVERRDGGLAGDLFLDWEGAATDTDGIAVRTGRTHVKRGAKETVRLISRPTGGGLVTLPASETEGKIAISTDVGDTYGCDVAIPGLNYLVHVEDVDFTSARSDDGTYLRGDDGGFVPVVALIYELMDGSRAEYVAARGSRIRRYVSLTDAKVRAEFGELAEGEAAGLVPALVDEVRSLRTRLDEARRMKADAEAEALQFRGEADQLRFGVAGAR